MNNLTQDQIELYMKEALKEAQLAKDDAEVPIGAVVVHEGKIIGRGHNLREQSQDATTHAEVLAIRDACQNLNSWRLWDCQLFVTIEPCLMCSGAIINSQLPAVYFGARDAKGGAVRSLYEVLEDSRLNHQVEVHEGTLDDQAAEMMQSFFKEIRARRKKSN